MKPAMARVTRLRSGPGVTGTTRRSTKNDRVRPVTLDTYSLAVPALQKDAAKRIEAVVVGTSTLWVATQLAETPIPNPVGPAADP